MIIILNRGLFSDNSVLMYGQYSRAGYDGTRTVFNNKKVTWQFHEKPPNIQVLGLVLNFVANVGILEEQVFSLQYFQANHSGSHGT